MLIEASARPQHPPLDLISPQAGPDLLLGSRSPSRSTSLQSGALRDGMSATARRHAARAAPSHVSARCSANIDSPHSHLSASGTPAWTAANSAGTQQRNRVSSCGSRMVPECEACLRPARSTGTRDGAGVCLAAALRARPLSSNPTRQAARVIERVLE
eukprot:1031557-Rhodomonas_salina.1